MKGVLKNYTAYFCPNFEDFYGVATFVKNDLTVTNQGNIVTYDNPNPGPNDESADHSRKLLWLNIEGRDGRKYLIMNTHGHWVPGDKQDNPVRINQSQAILDLVSQQQDNMVLCGDFNLRPDTKSVKMLESKFRNLVIENNIQSTRTSLYTKPEKWADYIFVSPNVKVAKFEVLPDVVSDHSPLLVEFQ